MWSESNFLTFGFQTDRNKKVLGKKLKNSYSELFFKEFTVEKHDCTPSPVILCMNVFLTIYIHFILLRECVYSCMFR